MPYNFNPFTGTFDQTAVDVSSAEIPDPLTVDELTVNTLLTADHIHGNIAGSVYIHIKNTDSVQLDAGTPFYITGTVGSSDRVEIQAADSSDPSKGPAVGLLEANLEVNGEGNGVLIGEIFNYDTDTPNWSTNDPLYVANGGGLTNIKPTSGYRQIIAYVGRIQQGTGTLVLTGTGVDPVASATVSATPPTSPTAGDLWYDSDSASLYVYYNDGNTSQWVSTSVGGVGATDPQNLSELLDVDFGGTTPADKSVLTYSSGLNAWQPQAPAQYYASFRPSTDTQSVDTFYARTIDFDEIVVRSDNWPLETVNPNGYIYVPVTGKYLVTVSTRIDATTTSTRNLLETSLYSTANGYVNRADSYGYSPNSNWYYASTHMSAIISVTNTASYVCYATALFISTAGYTVGNISQDSRLNIVYLGE